MEEKKERRRKRRGRERGVEEQDHNEDEEQGKKKSWKHRRLDGQATQSLLTDNECVCFSHFHCTLQQLAQRSEARGVHVCLNVHFHRNEVTINGFFFSAADPLALIISARKLFCKRMIRFKRKLVPRSETHHRA